MCFPAVPAGWGDGRRVAGSGGAGRRGTDQERVQLRGWEAPAAERADAARAATRSVLAPPPWPASVGHPRRVRRQGGAAVAVSLAAVAVAAAAVAAAEVAVVAAVAAAMVAVEVEADPPPALTRPSGWETSTRLWTKPF